MPEGQLQSPGAPQGTPSYPTNFQPIEFSGFSGLNTKASRPGIQDQEMAWCDNWQPLGQRNLRTLFDVGTPIYKAPAGDGIAFFSFGNISDSPLCVSFLSSGGITQINTSTLLSSIIAPASTILNTSNQIAMAQWGSQYLLMCAPQTNGYFIWDGSLFYQAGTIGPYVSISSGGNSYSAIPNMQAVGGHGSGANWTATVTSSGSVSSITPVTAGSGYTASDIVMIAFSGGGAGTCASAILTATLASGGVGSIIVATGGSGYTPAGVKLVLQGGGGIGATATATVSASGGPVSSVIITNPGQGYTSAPTVIVTDPNNPVCQATVPIMPFGLQGTAIETYTSRVWMANGAAPTTPPAKNLTVFSASGAPTDFTSANGGGNYLNNNSFARVGYHGLKQANGFLYEIADSSVDYISGVATSGNPPLTTFSNQNVDPQVGTPWPNTVQVFSRSVVFANTFGVHAVYGGAVQKVSDPLDGIYTTVAPVGVAPLLNGIQPSSAVAIVNGIHIYVLLLPIVDPYTGKTVNKCLCWDGKRWFTYQPSVTLTQIATQEINSVLTAYGTDGDSIYPLFKTPSTSITKVVQSKLWDTPAYFMRKRVQRILGLFQNNDTNPDDSTICVDTESGSVCVSTANIFAVTWFNNAGQIVNWINNSGQPVTWQATGRTTFQSAIEAAGVVVGLSMTTTAKDYTLISLMLTGQQFNVTV